MLNNVKFYEVFEFACANITFQTYKFTFTNANIRIIQFSNMFSLSDHTC